MGPLVPDIISGEFNFLIALIMGIGFGFALEQAGFSSTKKLVGLFYGYDFTVIKVFFTAGITAMIGILFLSHAGLINIEYVFVNPFFVRSAIVGGVIMGTGFIIGGFCPGTSICAASIGKVDAIAFIGGSIIGVFIFMEIFPLIEDFYMADAQGSLTIPGVLNISRTIWAILLTSIALCVFFAVTFIQHRVTGAELMWNRVSILQALKWASIPLVVLFIVFITPSRDEYVMQTLERKAATGECAPKLIDSDKLAYELINNYYNYNLIDVRSKEEFSKYHIPTAIHIPLDELGGLEYRSLFRQRIKTNVFYGSSVIQASRACLLARFHGDENGLALKENMDEFYELFYLQKPLGENPTKQELTVNLFRKDALRQLKEIESVLSEISKPVEKKERVVQGGCS